MLARLLPLFLITPAIELGLLMYVGDLIGFWPTIGLIIVTGIAGSLLAKREGLATWNRLNERLGEGGLPGKELVDGIIILVAGALLITPGVLTDVFGFMGLLPPTRALIRKGVTKWFQRKVERGDVSMGFGFFGGYGGGFEAETYGSGFDGDFPPGDPNNGSFDNGGPGGWSDGGPDPSPEADASESERKGDASWEGRRRQVPGHSDEVSESGSGSEKRDAV